MDRSNVTPAAETSAVDWSRIFAAGQNSRTSRVLSSHRCPGCEIRRPACFCSLIPLITLQTRVIILMHTSEEVLPSNTARLSAKALTNSEIRIHGRLGDSLARHDIVQEGRRSLLLFPSPFASDLTPEFVASLKEPVNLIVPDGKWRQSQKFVRRESALAGITHVRIVGSSPSEYSLRTQPNDASLCTLEAIARAIGVLESPAAQDQLESVLKVLVQRTLRVRGKLPSQKKHKPGAGAASSEATSNQN